MGLLDSVIGAIGQAAAAGGTSGAGAAAPAELMRAVLGLLGNESSTGGLPGLVEAFRRAGLGDVVASWIATGPNAPISADQLGQVLGGDLLGQVAGQLGVTPGDASGQLARWLPEIVDQLTPQGQMPAGGLGGLSELLGMLARR